MNNQGIFDHVSYLTSRQVTRSYSTSFSMGIRLLKKDLRAPIYAIYGFVRLADEIVDTFHGFDKLELLTRFKKDTWQAIEEGISLNPVLHSFQMVVRKYEIGHEWIHSFFTSMEMDLEKVTHDRDSFDTYVLGSAEVVGLMCLHVFCLGDNNLFEHLRSSARSLGAAFQKVNFLRDLHADQVQLGRNYFPGLDFGALTDGSKKEIEKEIAADFEAGYRGILKLPKQSRFGVYLAYKYYLKLFHKICKTPSSRILNERIRIPNKQKYALLLGSFVKHSFNML
jgi:15-cis-phytoene synthase